MPATPPAKRKSATSARSPTKRLPRDRRGGQTRPPDGLDVIATRDPVQMLPAVDNRALEIRHGLLPLSEQPHPNAAALDHGEVAGPVASSGDEIGEPLPDDRRPGHAYPK